MLQLADVMLCAVSSIAIPQTIAALNRSCEGIAFGDVVLLTDAVGVDAGPAIRTVEIAPLPSREAYSAFVLKDLWRHATRPHVLLIQWDGWAVAPARWDPAFLECDYVGAPWPQFGDGHTVGNGGFSLRSRRLLEVVGRGSFLPLHPEDTAICRTWRAELESAHGLRFASPALAERFAAERSGDPAETFGFHGLFNLPRVLDPAELHDLLASLPPALLRGRDARDLVPALAAAGQPGLAAAILRRRVREIGWTGGNLKLAWRLLAMGGGRFYNR